ncbi:uncharacterized protein C1orf167 homolog [Grammomys surdaster]|uniref:uncharacterized protein C1orf167 homolog n=1 Tax=Grammomys surdaster TaxID=491861 RepID=UPI0010A0B820|nr:uncharacterized protein C1orf167 homolog [Grammomys surdaster]
MSLGNGGGQRMPNWQITTYSQGPVLCQKPYQVQSNLASLRPHLALALKDTAGRLGDAGLWQQSNLQLPAGRSQGRTQEPFEQQSNLCFRGTSSPHRQDSCLPPTGPSSHQKQTLQVADTLCLDLRLSGGLPPLDGRTWPGPRPWCSSGSWAPRLVGEPLALEDLSVFAHSQSQNEAQSISTLDSQAACWTLLSKSFRVWRHLSQRRQAVAKATAVRHRQLIREHLRELHWVLWLQEAQLEAAWGQHAKALLARSFQEWRRVTLQQKLEQPHTQAAPTSLASRGSLSLEKKAAAELAWRCRCFRAWQWLVQRGAQYRGLLAHRRLKTLRVCLEQWMEMKQLRASDVTRVTRFALYWQKAGNEVLSSLVPGTAMAHCLETEAQAQQLSKGPDQCSPWEICQKLALYQALLLWKTRFYQHQQTISFQGMQKRVLQHILSQWHLRVWDPDPPSGDMKTIVLLSWSHWTAVQGAWGELAAHWARDRSCRTVMGLWRRRLAGWWAVQERPGARPGTGQQFLREQYQGWVQIHLQVLQKVVSRDWQQAIAEMTSEGGACRASVVWRATLGQCREAEQQAGRRAQVLTSAQVALCWVLWMFQSCLGWIHQAHAAQQPTTLVPEVWMRLAAQAYVRQAGITQCWQGLRCLLRTHRVQSQSTLVEQKLELQPQVTQGDPSAQASSSGCPWLRGPSAGLLEEAFEKWHQCLVARAYKKNWQQPVPLETVDSGSDVAGVG